MFLLIQHLLPSNASVQSSGRNLRFTSFIVLTYVSEEKIAVKVRLSARRNAGRGDDVLMLLANLTAASQDIRQRAANCRMALDSGSGSVKAVASLG